MGREERNQGARRRSANRTEARDDSLEVENPPAEPAERDDEPVESVPSLPSFGFSVCRTDYELTPEAPVDADRAEWINSRIRAIRTCGDARVYIEEVRRKALAARAGELEV